MTIPEPLQAAIAQHHRDNPHRSALPLTFIPGDVVLVAKVSYPFLVLQHFQWEVDEPFVLHGVFCHPYVEMAYDFDLILRDATPYALVCSGEMYRLVEPEAVRSTLATGVDPAVLEAIITALPSDGSSLAGFETGLPLGGVFDPRRTWMDSWLEEILAGAGFLHHAP